MRPLRPVTIAEVRGAAARIEGLALRTPLLRLNADAPAEVHLKLEVLQPVGSFKVRGAGNALRRMPPLSARRLPPSLPPLLSNLVEVGDAAVREPYVGITTDGMITPGLFPLARTGHSTKPMVDAACQLLSSLDPSQREMATFPIDADEWRRWCNVHIYLMRHGLLLEDLTRRQRDAALGLLRASLSGRGYDDVRMVMAKGRLVVAPRLDD